MKPEISNLSNPISFAFFLCTLATGLVCQARQSGKPDVSLVGRRTVEVDEAQFAQVYFVAPNSPATDADGSRNRPWPSIVLALSGIVTPAAHTRIALFVAEGIYQTGTIFMREQVEMYGGFEARSWKRDIFSHPTILDGGGRRRLLVGADKAKLDGFIIQNGRSQGPGGGLLCDSVSPIVTNNLFRDNHTLEPIGFRHDLIHQEGNRGGAVACLYNSVPRIANNVFYGNWTEVGDGAGVALYGWARLDGDPRAIIENNLFCSNVSGTRDRARTRSSSGGAIACSHEASPILRNNVFVGNRARGNSDAGGVYCEYFSSPLVEANWIVGNVCDDDGGGFYTMRLGAPLLRRNVIVGNRAQSGGVGGVRVSKEGRLLMERNLVAYNQSGGAILCVDGYAVIAENLIVHNLGGPGIGYRQQHRYFKRSRFERNQLWGNEGGPFEIDRGSGRRPKLGRNRTGTTRPASAPDDESPTDSMLSTYGTFERAEYDEDRAIWHIFMQSTGSLDQCCAGRAVRIGRIWGVARQVRDGLMYLWADSAAEFSVGAPIEVLIPPGY